MSQTISKFIGFRYGYEVFFIQFAVLYQLAENGEVYMVRRNYGKGSGFNQIR
jgi:hypothetical protein